MAMTEWKLRRAAVGQSGIQIVLCDDDPVFSQTLSCELIRIFKKLNVTASITALHDPTELTPQLLRTCDLAFLDIDFDCGEQNGIDLAGQLRQVNRHALLFFVTNYIDYAPAGYEVQAFRYVLKRDIESVLERYVLQAMENLAEGREHLRLREKEVTVDLSLEQILYLEVMDHYVSIHTGDCTHTVGTTLSSLEKELERHGFLRIHKSFLVNMAHIRKFRSRECLLDDGTALAVSEKNYSQQKQKYLLWKGLK